MQEMIGRKNSLANGGFMAQVDLYDLLSNEGPAISAMMAGDEQALRKVCPYPICFPG